MVDVLHTLDQGVAGHLCANIILKKMDSGTWGDTRGEQIDALNAALKKHYVETKEEYRVDGPLNMPRIKSSNDWPKLKVKAAACRRLVPWVLELAKQLHDGTTHADMLIGGAQTLKEIYDIISAHPRFLPRADRDRLCMLSRTFFSMYHWLSADAVSNNERWFKMTPKFHLMQHILEHQTWVSPRMSWTYGDEDLQRILKEVATSCHPRTVAYMVIFKWLCTFFE